MQRILAIAWLTWKAAFRFRLFLVIAVLLLAAVVGLPLLIKDDGTARGFTQILLTYTLERHHGAARAFHALACVRHAGAGHRGMPDAGRRRRNRSRAGRSGWANGWASCRSTRRCWRFPARCVYGLLQWRATKLPAAEQKICASEVLVARGSAKEKDLRAEIDADDGADFAGTLEKQSGDDGGFAGSAASRSASRSRRSIRSCRRATRAPGRLTWASRKIICATSRCNCA